MDKLIIQSDLCDGCLDCQEACAKLHGESRISIHEVDGSYFPIVCQHCEDASCEVICPTEANSNGKINPDKCIGCGLCMMVCPFGSISISEKKAQKCTLCADRDEKGCVKACSKRAISCIDIDRLKLEKQKKYLDKLSGIGIKTNNTNYNDVVSAQVKANKELKK